MSNSPRPEAVPSLPRLLLPVIGILVVVVVGAVALSLLKPGGERQPALIGPRLAIEPEGVVVNASVNIQDKTLEFVKAFRSPGFLLDHAPEGMEFVVVRFKPLASNAGSLLEAVKGFQLTAGSASFGIFAINLTNADEVKSNGAVVFVVPKDQGPDFELHLTPGSTLPLNLPPNP